MQRCVLLLFYADFLLVSKFFMHFCFHFHLNLFKPLCTKGLKAVEEEYFSSTLLPLSYITTECQSPYDWRVLSRKETLKFSREFWGLSVTNYELYPYKLRVCRCVTLLKQIVEEKWKRNKPLPPLRLPLYKVVLKDLVEVEAKLDKNIWRQSFNATCE